MGLKAKFRNWLRAFLNEQHVEEPLKGSLANIAKANKISAVEGGGFAQEGMKFTLYTAEGGQVLEFRSYDNARDRFNTRLYLVNDGDNFAERIAEIVTLEAMKR